MSGNQSLPAGGLPPVDLGKEFGVQDQRRGRLGSLLPGTAPAGPPPRVDPAPAEPAPEPPAPAPVADVEPAPTPPHVVDEAPASEEAGTRQLIVYMPDRIRARLRRAAVGSSQLDVMLDAVEQTERSGVLGDLVQQHQSPDTSGLFARRPARGSDANVQVNARAMHQHVEVLDRLAAKYDTNRSELIRVALDHVLPGGPRRRR